MNGVSKEGDIQDDRWMLCGILESSKSLFVGSDSPASREELIIMMGSSHHQSQHFKRIEQLYIRTLLCFIVSIVG